MEYYRRAQVVGRQIRTEFSTRRAVFFNVLGTIKALFGATPEKVADGQWYWWVADSDRNRLVLKNLGFKLVDEEFKHGALENVSPLLRKYQIEGVHYMDRYGGSILLGDDMGLGKSCQALSYVAYKTRYPLVIVCPASLKLNWCKEYYMWCGTQEQVTVLNGRKPYFFTEKVVVINYDILHNWLPTLLRMNPVQIIADEVQLVKKTKGKEAMRTKAFRELVRDRPLLALSGTPIESRPYEFFNILNMLRPTIFRSAFRFGQRYCGPSKNSFTGFTEYDGATNIPELNALLKDIMLRRRKSEVLTELPEKQRVMVPIEIERQYVKDYNELAFGTKNNLAHRGKKDQMHILAKIEKMKQLAFKMKYKGVIKWIQDYLDTGNKLVVFTTHRESLRLLVEAFSDISVRIEGSMNTTKRQASVDAFQEDPNIKLCVANLQAGGVGWTLTAASATVHLEYAWKPSHHTQGEDRVHRMGQKADSVFAYYLVAPNTIDEWLLEIINSKQQTVTAVLDGFDIEQTAMFEMLTEKFSKMKRVA